MSINFKVIGLTRLGIKPESTASEADALTTRPSELLKLGVPMAFWLSSLVQKLHSKRNVGLLLPLEQIMQNMVKD